ncbi:MEX3C.2 family protein [Megaselia abdita]
MGSTSITPSFSQPSNKILSSPGQTTIQVRVPYRVVGLVVGPKGATIKNIQNETQTYIVTPSRDKEPVFEVTGSLESVREAKRQIEGHIALRTGGGNFCIRDENETDHDDRFCSGSGTELVNIWKNIICEDSGTYII